MATKRNTSVKLTPDILAFMQRTGQMGLLQTGQNAPVSASGSPPEPVSGLPGVSTAEAAPKGRKTGKKRLEMNGLEREFSMMLERDRLEGKIHSWKYEPITLRWGELDTLKYTADFVTFDKIKGFPLPIPRRFIETKPSFMRNPQAALRTFKEARNHWFGIFEFELWQKTKDQGWQQIF